MPARIANGPGPSRIAPTASAARTMPVRNAVGTFRSAASSRSPADLHRRRLLPAGSAEALAADPDGARGLLRRLLLVLVAEQRGDRDLLGGLERGGLGLHLDLVADGLREVVGRGLDGLEVGGLLPDDLVLGRERLPVGRDLDVALLGRGSGLRFAFFALEPSSSSSVSNR